MNKDWFVGFIEGEGNFHVNLAKNFKTSTWKYSFEFYPLALAYKMNSGNRENFKVKPFTE